MRKTLLILGGLLVALAVYLLALHWGQSTGEIWASIDPNSIVGFGSLIENKVDPDLWIDVILPVLQWQAWILPLVLGLLLVLAGRPWKGTGASDTETLSEANPSAS
jgi:hypothetical protein